MANLDFDTMQNLQQALQNKYQEKWGGLSPQKGRNMLLWMMIEMGEAADVIKKQGDERILSDEPVRGHFVEELCDVLMYFNDVLLCYGIKPEELAAAYLEKHDRNMRRW